jgi:cytochrome c553
MRVGNRIDTDIRISALDSKTTVEVRHMRFRNAIYAALICASSAAFGATPEPGDSEAAELPMGQRLFQEHGCTNCHGADGVHPEARYVPVLRGKPATDLYAHAKEIFGGRAESDKTVFMHDQFCIGQANEEGCYEPPSDADLRIIANWLGSAELPKKKQTDLSRLPFRESQLQGCQPVASRRLYQGLLGDRWL